MAKLDNVRAVVEEEGLKAFAKSGSTAETAGMALMEEEEEEHQGLAAPADLAAGVAPQMASIKAATEAMADLVVAAAPAASRATAKAAPSAGALGLATMAAAAPRWAARFSTTVALFGFTTALSTAIPPPAVTVESTIRKPQEKTGRTPAARSFRAMVRH